MVTAFTILAKCCPRGKSNFFHQIVTVSSISDVTRSEFSSRAGSPLCGALNRTWWFVNRLNCFQSYRSCCQAVFYLILHYLLIMFSFRIFFRWKVHTEFVYRNEIRIRRKTFLKTLSEVNRHWKGSLSFEIVKVFQANDSRWFHSLISFSILSFFNKSSPWPMDNRCHLKIKL